VPDRFHCDGDQTSSRVELLITSNCFDNVIELSIINVRFFYCVVSFLS